MKRNLKKMKDKETEKQLKQEKWNGMEERRNINKE